MLTDDRRVMFGMRERPEKCGDLVKSVMAMCSFDSLSSVDYRALHGTSYTAAGANRACIVLYFKHVQYIYFLYIYENFAVRLRNCIFCGFPIRFSVMCLHWLLMYSL